MGLFIIFGFILIVMLVLIFTAIIDDLLEIRSPSAVEKVRNHINSLKPDTFDDFLDHKKEWHQEKIRGDR